MAQDKKSLSDFVHEEKSEQNLENNNKDISDIEESATTMITEVESEVQKRVNKATKKAKSEAEKNEQIVTQNSKLFLSPKIKGAYLDKNKYTDSKIVFEFISETPDGQENMKVILPDEDKIKDKDTELNRLLSYYNIKLENIGDMVGEKLPIRPLVKESKESHLKLGLDLPPVRTKPNYIIYNIRRFLEKKGFVEWGNTPKRVRREIVKERSKYCEPMTEKANGLVMFLGKNKERTVPTEKGVASLITIMWATCITFTYFAFNPNINIFISLISFLLSQVLLFISVRASFYSVPKWTKESVEKIKSKYFP